MNKGFIMDKDAERVSIVSYRPNSRYLKLHNGDFYDRQTDTVIEKDRVLLEVCDYE